MSENEEIERLRAERNEARAEVERLRGLLEPSSENIDDLAGSIQGQVSPEAAAEAALCRLRHYATPRDQWRGRKPEPNTPEPIKIRFPFGERMWVQPDYPGATSGKLLNDAVVEPSARHGVRVTWQDPTFEGDDMPEATEWGE